MSETAVYAEQRRAAKTHMTACQGEPDSNLHPKREQRCALSLIYGVGLSAAKPPRRVWLRYRLLIAGGEPAAKTSAALCSER